MKKPLLFLLIGACSALLHADDEDCCEETCDYLFEFTTGYRQDQLKIRVTPPEPEATVISLNNWKDVDIVQFRLTFKAETPCWTYSRAYFNYGRLVEFKHELVSPTLLLNPSKTHHEKGRVYDAEYAFGFSLPCSDNLRLTPLGGYTYHRIEFESHNRVPLNFVPDSEEIARYNYLSVVSKQRTTWQGPFVGLEAEIYCDCMRLCVNGEYVWAHYNNHGKDKEKYNQTYRYKQRSNGHGTIVGGELAYTVMEGWEAVLTGQYQYWDVKGGKDWTKYSADPDTEIKSHLHSASWQSFEVSLGIGYLF